MKKFSLLLLVAMATAYAADSSLVLSDEIIAMGDKVVKLAWERACEQSVDRLWGTVSGMYCRLEKGGYRHLMQRNPAAVARAVELVSFLTDATSENDDVKTALAAFAAAQKVPQDADLATKLMAWKGELQAYSVALIKRLKKELPEDLVISPLTTDRILANNGKLFPLESITILEAGTLAVLAGFERRRNAMGHEAFAVFCDAQLLNSPAHHAISTIAIPESK